MSDEPNESSSPETSDPPAAPPTDHSVDALLSLFSLYASIQVQADTNDYNRTSVFTLIQGLLLVGFQQGVSAGVDSVLGIAIAGVGALLSFSWLAVEQRTLLYFNARARILRSLESQLVSVFDQQPGVSFQRFWTVGDDFVRSGSSWYQRFSAQKVLRFYMPLLFAALWILAIVWLVCWGVTEAVDPIEIKIVR